MVTDPDNYYLYFGGVMAVLSVLLILIPPIIAPVFQPIGVVGYVAVTEEYNDLLPLDFKEGFNKTYNKQYKASYNCKNKSEDFAKYLAQYGVTDIKLIQTWNKDYSQGHQAVLVKGYVYDPTTNIWGLSKKDYLALTKENGMDGLTAILPYTQYT